MSGDAAAARVKLTAKEVATIKASLRDIDAALREYEAYPSTRAVEKAPPGSTGPKVVVTVKPLSERHQLLIEQRKRLGDLLLAAGEEVPAPRRAKAVPPKTIGSMTPAPRPIIKDPK